MMPKFGLLIPQGGLSFASIRDIAMEAEELEFDSLWVHDHLALSGQPYLECWTILSSLATLTKRIRLGPLVLCNLFRSPALVAKMSATLDNISNGRLELGIGAGWHKGECNAYGVHFGSHKERIARLDEAIHILKLLWSGRQSSFHGRYYNISNALSLPKPVQSPHPTLFVGGKSSAILELVARHGVGLNVDQEWGINLEMLINIFADLESKVESLGRKESEIEKSFCVCISVGRTREEAVGRLKKDKRYARSRVYRRKLTILSDAIKHPIPVVHKVKSRLTRKSEADKIVGIVGTPEDCANQLSAYMKVGVDHFIFRVPDPTDKKTLELIADKVISDLRKHS